MDTEKKLSQIWKTYSARFNASRRLKKESNYELWIPALLSIYVLAMNILQLLPGFKLTPEKQAYITLFTISLSLLLVVISLIWGSADTKLKSENYHNCALEMKGLYDHLEFIASNQDNELFQKEYIKYNELEKKYSLNHEYLDYKIIEIKSVKGFAYFISFIQYKIEYYIKCILVKHLLIVVPFIIGIYIIVN